MDALNGWKFYHLWQAHPLCNSRYIMKTTQDFVHSSYCTMNNFHRTAVNVCTYSMDEDIILLLQTKHTWVHYIHPSVTPIPMLLKVLLWFLHKNRTDVAFLAHKYKQKTSQLSRLFHQCSVTGRNKTIVCGRFRTASDEQKQQVRQRVIFWSQVKTKGISVDLIAVL